MSKQEYTKKLEELFMVVDDAATLAQRMLDHVQGSPGHSCFDQLPLGRVIGARESVRNALAGECQTITGYRAEVHPYGRS